jgi:hypothetical protein
MPDQKTVNRSTVDTSDPDAIERRDHESDAFERDAPEGNVAEPGDPTERGDAERDVLEGDVVEPDASEAETARERADMVGVTEPSDDARPDLDGPTAPDAARNTDAAPDVSDAEPARDADVARDEQMAQDGSRGADASPVAEPSMSVETPASTPDGAPIALPGDGQESSVDNAAELAPGDVPAPPSTTLWAGEDGEALRERWRELQSRFVDDPRGAAAAADDLIGEAVDSITQELAAQRRQLGEWRAGGDFDTERLRVAVTGYRDFLDRVLSI